MAINQQIIKKWIQYLKSNQIASLQSDPKTGELQYRRPVNADDLHKFLNVATNFDEQVINDAIDTVLQKKTGGNTGPEQIGHTDSEDGHDAGQAQIGHDDGITDVDYTDIPNEPRDGSPRQIGAPQKQVATPAKRGLSQTPGAVQKREQRAAAKQSSQAGKNRFGQMVGQFDQQPSPETPEQKKKIHTKLKTAGSPGQKPRVAYKGLREAIRDTQGPTLDEKDVEDIFDILSSQQSVEEPDTDTSSKQAGKQTRGQKAEVSPEEAEAKKDDDIRSIKRLIRDTLTPGQRKALWRALQEENLSESQINHADIKAVFKDASALRDKSSGFWGSKKEKIDVNDLQQAWAKGDKEKGIGRYSDDTRDISAILKDHGFGDKEINKVFSQVFGSDGNDEDEYIEPTASAEIQKVADYVKKHDMADELRAFMKKEFSEELGIDQKQDMFSKAKQFGKKFFKKAVAEDVRQIFTAIVQEERTERTRLIKQQEQTHLGRTRK